MLKFAFTFLVVIHGLIHLLGFVKAFNLANVSQLNKSINKPTGFIWLLASVLFLLVSVFYFAENTTWWLFGFIAILVSQVLIMLHWKDARFGTIANVIILLFVVVNFSSWRYHHQFVSDVNENLNQQEYFDDKPLTESDIEHLPEPIKKYLRYTNALGKPKVNNFKVEFVGKIRQNDQSEWMPFASEQYNFMQTPIRLFFMKAKMKNLPVDGYHKFVNGSASMDIRLLSLFRVQYMDGDDMNMAETVTFFNDMCLMAPSTLIDPRIQWLEVEGNDVRASFTVNSITITAWLYFNDDGELVNFISGDRYNADAGKKTDWLTPASDYREVNGYKLARYAETVYRYPDGDMVYGTFTTSSIIYNIK